MSNQKDDGASHKESGPLSNMRAGDVLAARPSSVLEHDISIVPEAPHARVATHGEAVERAAGEAEALAVDAWITEDQIHVVKLSANRPDGE